jgi:predicted transcriptional regulator
MAAIAFRCSDELNKMLEEKAEEEGRSKSALIIEALEQYFGVEGQPSLVETVDRHTTEIAELRALIKRLGASPKPRAIGATTTPELNSEVLKLANRLKADPDGLQMSVRAGIAEGLGGKALCDFLFEYGHGANSGGKPFHPSVAGRLVKAIAYLDGD